MENYTVGEKRRNAEGCKEKRRIVTLGILVGMKLAGWGVERRRGERKREGEKGRARETAERRRSEGSEEGSGCVGKIGRAHV